MCEEERRERWVRGEVEVGGGERRRGEERWMRGRLRWEEEERVREKEDRRREAI